MADGDAGGYRGCSVKYEHWTADGGLYVTPARAGVRLQTTLDGLIIAPDEVPALIAAIRIAAGLEEN
ncbi:hypothetical protein HEK616_40680 [Streptomyces nigrescens]|uniref:Uncharacterized protein n=1 Tax=Streptomyces nigrescens TaxID=1920 RepID=A0ABM7ZWH2_STRNI|nr:hypothetical protein HEK616_40680 [Streptomyces nigrescens]